MGWLLSLVIIAILIAFNMFAADTMVRLRRDVLEIHKAVVVDEAAKAAKAADGNNNLG